MPVGVGWRSLFVCVVCYVAGLGCCSATAIGEVVGSSGAGAGGSALLGGPLVEPEVEALVGSGSVAEAEEVRRASPEAVAAREVSQTAYEGLGSGASAKLAGQVFTGVVGRVDGGLPALMEGASVLGYASPNAAEVALAGGQHAVVESVVPLATRSALGGWSPVDLSLSEVEGGFRVANPLVGVGIPGDLADGVSLTDSGVSLTPVSSAGVAVGGSPGVVDGAVVFYGGLGVGSDVDGIVKPTPEGFAEDVVLRSELSPGVLYFRVGLPAGGSLAMSGSGVVRVMVEGAEVASVLPVEAVDAAGTRVPVTMTVSGDVLKLAVPREVGQFEYPIEVDPTVTDSQLKESYSPRLTSAWKAYTENGLHSPFDPREESGAVLDSSGGRIGVKVGEWGAFEYETQGKSHIYGFVSETSGSSSNAAIVENRLTIHRGTTHEKEEPMGDNYGTTRKEVCVVSGCATGTVTEGDEHNVAEFEQWATESNVTEFSSIFTGAAVEILQEEGPSGHFDATDATVTGHQNVFYGRGEEWVNKKEEEAGAGVEFDANDPGIGISEFVYSSPSDPGLSSWDKHSFLNSSELGGCKGVQCEECVGWNYCTAGARESTYSPLTGIPDGEDLLEATVKNATGASATASKYVRIDTTPPHDFVLSGLPAGNEIGEREYKVRVEATDGEPGSGIATSGVASMSVAIDGRTVEHAAEGSNKCIIGPCTSHGEWSINGAEYGAGEHVLTVIATDAAGNVGSQTFSLKVHDGATPITLGPGSVNPESGNYTLQTSDVSIGTGPGALTVGRTYASRHITAGTYGPLGPQWSMNTGGEETLTKLPEGNMTLTATNGGKSIFVSNKKGGFTSPAGDVNLTLAEAEKEKVKEFVLSDAAGAVGTRFVEPSGGAGEIWVPSVEEGAVTADTTSYVFRAVKIGGKEITEPTEMLGPVPAGVSCAPKLERGCRALTFKYAEETTAKGEGATEWGDYAGRLKQVYFTAWEPTKSEMVTKTVAQYSYDPQGRLRAEWNPEVSPELKTEYGYDAEGHLTALTQPGQETWAFVYGTASNDPNTGRLLSVARPPAATALWDGMPPAVKSGGNPTLSSVNPIVGSELTVSHGNWTNEPSAFGYQWYDCNIAGGECTAILGAVDEHYTPLYRDEGKRLEVTVTATNGGGSAASTVAAAGVVPPAYVTQWGKEGTGTGQFKSPRYIAAADGSVFVVDTGNNRVQEFAKEGKYLKSYGSVGTEPGEFKEPLGIAADSKGSFYVADSGNKRIELFTLEEGPKGHFRHSTAATATPVGLALGPAYREIEYNVEKVFATGAKANGVGAFCGEAEYPNETMSILSSCSGSFGAEGTGELQFKSPTGIAYGTKGLPEAKDGYIYVVDGGNDRVEKLYNKAGENITTFEQQFGSKGTGNAQLQEPAGVALTEPAYQTYNAWIADSGNNRIEEFGPKGEYLSQLGSLGTSAGQFNHPTGIASGPNGTLYVADTANNRVQEFQEKPTEAGPTVAAPPPPSSANSVWTIDYQVPVSGTGAPNEMTSKELERWAQKDDPIEATAIFPPDKPMGWPAKEYTRSTIYYMDTAGHTVNVAVPTGGITTSEYNANNGVVRSLSADNRATALAEGTKSKEISETLDTQNTYNTEGTELQGTLGPQHTVKLASGSEVKARSHTLYYYDESAPTEGGPYRLATKVTQAAKLTSGEETEIHTSTTSYSGQENLGWKLRRPTSVTTDPAGLKLTRTTLYEASTGEPIETRMPASTGTGSPHDTQTIYYSSGANSSYPACGNHPEWAGLACQTQPAAQPTGTLPKLPVTTATYNIWDAPETTTSTSGTSTRTTTTRFDAEGRTLSSETTSTSGTALAKVSYEYSSETGAPIKQSRTTEGKTQTITQANNKLGELESYTDADGNTATFEYDIDGRPTHASDGKGTQTYSYSTTTGLLSELSDSAAGTFTAGYDPEGHLTSERYPNAMTATRTYSPTGEAISLQYTKSSYCGTSCTWFSDTTVPTTDGQWASQISSLAKENYSYDAAGRLTEVQETPSGEGCTTRLYGYDQDTNRTSLTTRAPGSEGKCATSGGTVESHTYDEADRLTDTNVAYNPFGEINTLPAADAGGHELTSTYYASGQTQSITQNSQTLTYSLDPAGRTRETTATGTTNTKTINHYDGPGNTPAWTEEPTTGNTTRYIQGLSGLAAIQTNSATPELQLTDLQGNIIATAAKSETETKLLHTERTTEYGTPTTSTPRHYSWQGSSQQPTELPSGTVAMGARTYIPQLGRFLQTDPQPGGSANAYAYTYGNPTNESDPTGELTWGFSQENTEYQQQASQELIQREAARQAAATAEANRKMEEATIDAAAAARAHEHEAGSFESDSEEEGEPLILTFTFGGGGHGARAAGLSLTGIVDTVEHQVSESFKQSWQETKHLGSQLWDMVNSDLFQKAGDCYNGAADLSDKLEADAFKEYPLVTISIDLVGCYGGMHDVDFGG
jgi:RHS repeat-associated protein